MSDRTSATARIITGVLGAVAVALGVALALRPLTTLQVTVWAAAAVLAMWAVVLVRGARGRAWPWGLTVGLVVGAAALVAFTPYVIGAYPVLLSAALTLSAARLLVRGLRRSRVRTVPSRAGAVTDRVVDVVVAATSLVAAVLVWLWPDVGLLLFAVAVAAVVAIAGALRVWRALRGPRREAARRPGLRRAGRVTGALLAAALATAASLGSAWMFAQVAPVDDFYTWTEPVPSEPGALLRVGAYDGETPAGSTALRILYATERPDGSPAVASAVVALPTASAPSDGRTVIAWQHGTTGVARTCAPSLETNALSEYAIPGISRMIDRGWALVAADYPGMGTTGRYPYLIGAGEGQSTLDGVRALRQLDDAHASDRVMLWGHSQGGHATLWAAELADDYAPELDVSGVAALSSATDPLALAQRITGGTGSALANAVTAYVVVPYTDECPDLSLVNLTHPAGSVFADAAASRCATDPGTAVTLLVTLGLGGRDDLYDLDLDTGPVHDRLEQNIATALVPAPLFLGQGEDDQVVSIEIQRATDARVCAAGRPVETHEYPGRCVAVSRCRGEPDSARA